MKRNRAIFVSICIRQTMAEQAARNYTVSKAFDRRYTKLYGLCGPIDANQPDSVAYNSHRTDCVSLFGRETTGS